VGLFGTVAVRRSTEKLQMLILLALGENRSRAI